MRYFKIEIGFGTDSTKSTEPLANREKLYMAGIAVIVICGAVISLWRVV